MKMSKEVIVSVKPTCNFCYIPAEYDGKTQMGPWAYMCQRHFDLYGIGLGLGKGQKLVAREESLEQKILYLLNGKLRTTLEVCNCMGDRMFLAKIIAKEIMAWLEENENAY